MVRKIAGKSPATNIKHLNLNDTEITEIPDIANSLGQTFFIEVRLLILETYVCQECRLDVLITHLVLARMTL